MQLGLCTVGIMEVGWAVYKVFDNTFTYHFMRNEPPARPLLLLFDGCSTNYHPGFVTKAACEQVYA